MLKSSKFRVLSGRLALVLSTSVLPVMLLALAGEAQGATVTFAQIQQVNSGQVFSYISNGSNSTISVTNDLVLFSFLGLPGVAVTTVEAYLNLSASSTQAAANSGFGTAAQGGFLGSFSITALQPVNGKTNVLTGVFDSSNASLGATLFGSGGSGSVFNSTGPNNQLEVSYSSQFVSFPNPVSENFSFALSSIEPPLHQQNGALGSFTASVTGTFASDPAPVAAPEASSFASLGLGLIVFGSLAHFRRKKAARKE